MTTTTSTTTATWAEDNQRYLSAALTRLGDLIAPGPEPAAAPAEELDALAAQMSRPPALLALCAAFGLSPFERDLLLMSAGMELDAGFQRKFHQASGAGASPSSAPVPVTFSHALALLPGAHWSAIAPSAPLRRWRLIELAHGGMVTQLPLRAAERVLHFLAGVQTVDAEIEGVVTVLDPPIDGAGPSAELPAPNVR